MYFADSSRVVSGHPFNSDSCHASDIFIPAFPFSTTFIDITDFSCTTYISTFHPNPNRFPFDPAKNKNFCGFQQVPTHGDAMEGGRPPNFDSNPNLWMDICD